MLINHEIDNLYPSMELEVARTADRCIDPAFFELEKNSIWKNSELSATRLNNPRLGQLAS
jgi:hypothetical protein